MDLEMDEMDHQISYHCTRRDTELQVCELMERI
jgi:hypothetical protein